MAGAAGEGMWRGAGPWAMAWAGLGVFLGGAVGLAVLLRPGDPGPPPDWSVAAEKAATEAVLAALPPGEQAPEWRDLLVSRFGREEERGVCGRVQAGTRTGGTWADFAVRVRLERPAIAGQEPALGTEVYLAEGAGGPRALYIARQRFCRDGAAAPQPVPREAPRAPLPPMPPAENDAIPVARDSGGFLPAAMTAGATALPEAAPVQGGGAGRIVVRSPVNLRTGPGGGATVLGVLPRGKVLQVLERAPGGWLRVGDPAPLGWVHASLTGPATD